MALTNHLFNEHQVHDMFSRVAPHYDRLNDVVSLGTQRKWRKRFFNLLNLAPAARCLDVCCGTGDLTIELSRRCPYGQITGLDFNEKMLELAHQKAGNNPHINFVVGDAMHLPLASNQYDLVTIGFGLRNVPDANRCLKELYRVLKPGGQLGILEMSQPTNHLVRVGWKAYFAVFPYLARATGGNLDDYRYLRKSAEQFVGADRLKTMCQQAGFKKVHYQRLNLGAAAIHLAEKP